MAWTIGIHNQKFLANDYHPLLCQSPKRKEKGFQWMISINFFLETLRTYENACENTMGTPEQNVSFICIKHHYLSCHFLYRMAHIMIANLVKLTFYTSFQPVRYHGWSKDLRWLESKWQVQRIACCLKVYRSVIYICN